MTADHAARLRAWLADDALAPKAADVEAALDELEQLRAERPSERDGKGPGVPGAMHLEAFGQSIADAFGHCPYHVGSSATSKTGWRDVDVRLILDDDQFHALFPGFKAANHIDAWWSLLCAALSELGRVRTGLPIDFQVQSMTEANAKYPGIRHPLFLIHAKDEYRPAMAAPQQPERDGATCAFPGCAHPDHQANRDAAAKFATDMERLEKNDPAGAQWLKSVLTERAPQQPERDGEA